jgi:hypothetical protein
MNMFFRKLRKYVDEDRKNRAVSRPCVSEMPRKMNPVTMV